MLHTTITRAAAKNKAIDFRDRLTLANQNDYAMMHGSGGKNYNVKSTVKCVICDYIFNIHKEHFISNHSSGI